MKGDDHGFWEDGVSICDVAMVVCWWMDRWVGKDLKRKVDRQRIMKKSLHIRICDMFFRTREDDDDDDGYIMLIQ